MDDDNAKTIKYQPQRDIGSSFDYPPPGYFPNTPPPSYYTLQPTTQDQQEQPQVFVVGASPTTPVGSPLMVDPPEVKLVEAFVLSCFVFCCCGWLFGGIAFIFAIVAQSSASAGDIRGAIKMRNASFSVSFAGIAIGIVIIIFVITRNYGATARNICYSPFTGTNHYC